MNFIQLNDTTSFYTTFIQWQSRTTQPISEGKPTANWGGGVSNEMFLSKTGSQGRLE